MRRTPRGSEKRMKREKRGAENSGRMQGMSTKRKRREKTENREKKKRNAETSDAMRRAPSDSEEREMMREISKKLRRSRRKVEKLEITLLSLNAGLKSQAKKLGIYAM